MRKIKYDWKYGENKSQKYYDVYVNGDYLCVFKNNWEHCWMCMVKDKIVYDKTRNDRQRKKQGLGKGCDVSLLRSVFVLCSQNPEILMRKAEYCYNHGITEISNN